MRRQELMPYWEIEPSGVQSAQVTEVPGSAGLGFRLFPWFVRVCPKMIKFFIFPPLLPGLRMP